MAKTTDSFDVAPAKTATRVRHVELKLGISEDDIPEIVADPTADPPIVGEPARTDTMYNGSYRFDILDQDGVVLEVRQGEIGPHLTPAVRTNLRDLLDTVMTRAKGSI